MALWSPTQNSPKIWLDPSDNTTITESSGDVSAIADKSGNNHSFSQTSNALQPSNTVTIGGKSALNFSDDFLISDDAKSNWKWMHDGSTAWETFFVGSIGGTSNPNNIQSILSTQNLTSSEIGVAIFFDDRSSQGNNNAARLFSGNGSATVVEGIVGNAMQMQQSAQFYFTANPGSGTAANRSSFALNGQAPIEGNSNATYGASSSDPEDNLVLGALNGGASFRLTGVLGEVLVYDRELTPTERSVVQGYLAWKWGLEAELPANHAYKNGAPLDDGSVDVAAEAGPTGPTRDWTPNDTTTALWLDPTDNESITLDGTNKIEIWNDKKNNGVGFTQPNASLRPAIGTENGKNTASFNGDLLLGNDAAKDLARNTEKIALFSVVKKTGAGTSFFWVSSVGGGSKSARFACAYVSAPGIRVDGRRKDTDPYRSSDTFNVVLDNQLRVTQHVANYAIASVEVGADGSKIQDSSFQTAGTTDNTRSTVMTLGATPDETLFFNGELCELIVLKGTFSVEDEDKIIGYLAWRWGAETNLPANHPYKNAAPQVTETTGTFVRWTPADRVTALWLDASDDTSIVLDTTTDSNIRVEEWTDKSGNSRHAKQDSEPFSRPVLAGSAIGGLSAIDFDGNNDHLILPTGFVPANASFYIVARPDDVTARHHILRRGSSPWSWIIRADAGNLDVFLSADTDSTSASRSVTAGSPFIISTTYDGAAHIAALNGTEFSTATLSGPIDSGSYENYLGAQRTTNNTSNFWDGLICEIIVVDEGSTLSERQQIEGYLAWKWGLEGDLPASHPYKDQAPGEFVGGGGGQITGTVTVNGSPAVRSIIGITYQPQTITPETGDPFEQRQIVGETVSAEDGTYTLDTGSFLEETIVLALENYGEVWKPNRELAVGDRLRPTQPNQTGYVYEITLAGNSGADEPTWIIPTGAVTTMDIGTATAQGLPLFWSLAHAPILPEATGPVTINYLQAFTDKIIELVPTIFYLCDAQTGDNALIDLGTGGNDASFTGGIANDTDVGTVFERGIEFDGSNDYATMPNVLNFIHKGEPFALLFGAKIPGYNNGAYSTITGNSYGVDATGFSVIFEDRSSFGNNSIRMYFGGAGLMDYTFDLAVPDANLHDYALVSDGSGSLTIYRDGALVETATGMTGSNQNNAAHAPLLGALDWQGTPDKTGQITLTYFAALGSTLSPVEIDDIAKLATGVNP